MEWSTLLDPCAVADLLIHADALFAGEEAGLRDRTIRTITCQRTQQQYKFYGPLFCCADGLQFAPDEFHRILVHSIGRLPFRVMLSSVPELSVPTPGKHNPAFLTLLTGAQQGHRVVDVYAG